MADIINTPAQKLEEHYRFVTKPKDITNGRKKQFDELDLVIESYGEKTEQLIAILKEAQDIFGYLPEEVQTYIAEKMGLPVSEVNGVVTFYSLFSTEPKGKNIINVCMGTACYVKGAQDIMNGLKSMLEIDEGETTANGILTLKSTRCIGACGLAPVLLVDEEIYGKLTQFEIKEIINKYQKDGHFES